ncbi:MAG: hypothetical protein ACRDT4_15795, partial [Micromonosporaceae bacterium]
MAEIALGVRDRGGRQGTGTAALVALDAATSVVRRIDVDLAADVPERRLFHAMVDPGAEAPIPDTTAVRHAAAAAEAAARDALDDLIAALPGHRLVGIAVPVGVPGPEVLDLPVAEILASHSLAHAAEAELYRDALATAATAVGLPVTRYPVRGLRAAAANALGVT